MPKWYATSTPGVRYRLHEGRKGKDGKPDKPPRKHGKQVDRFWEVRYRLDGKLHTSGVGWWSQKHTMAEAVALLAELKKNARTAEGPQTLKEKRADEDARRHAAEVAAAQAAQDNMTLANFWTSTYLPKLEASSKSATSKRTEKGLWENHIDDAIGARPVREVGKFDVVRLAKAVKDAKRTPATAVYACAVVRQMLNLAADLGLFTGRCPVDMRELRSVIGKGGMDNRRLATVTPEDFARLLAALGPGDVRDACILAYDCGLRAGEAFGLCWGHVDLEAGHLVLVDTKSGHTRVVPLTARARETLKARPAGNRGELVFPPSHGARRVYQKEFSKAVDAAELNKDVKDRRLRVVFHSLRHSYASALATAGVPLHTLAELLGHRSMAMVSRYAHSNERARQEAVRQLEQHQADALASAKARRNVIPFPKQP